MTKMLKKAKRAYRCAVAVAACAMLSTLMAFASPPTGSIPEDVTLLVRRVAALDPTQIDDRGESSFVIRGHGFEPGVIVQVGPHRIQNDLIRVNPDSVSVSVSRPLSPGLYTVKVAWPDGSELCAPSPLAVREQACSLKPIPFKKESADIDGEKADPAAVKNIGENIACMARGERTPLLILGVASREGPEGLNRGLAKRRAEAVTARVKSYLPQANLVTIGLGHALPAALGSTESELAKSRRTLLIPWKSAPCQSLRLFLDGEGVPDAASRALAAGQAKCLTDRGVTAITLLVPESGAPNLNIKEIKQFIDGILQQGSGGTARIEVHVMYAQQQAQSAMDLAYGMAPAPRGKKYVDVHPLSWFTPPARLASMDSASLGCVSEQIRFQRRADKPNKDSTYVVQAPPVDPGKGQEQLDAFAQLRLGSMRALGQTHLGGSVRMGKSLAHFGQGRWQVILAADLSIFGGEHAYRIANDLNSRVVVGLNAGPGISTRVGPFRFEAMLLPGVIMPAASAFLADADATAAWRLSERLELLATFGGGISIWKGPEVDGHWRLGLGGCWWL